MITCHAQFPEDYPSTANIRVVDANGYGHLATVSIMSVKVTSQDLMNNELMPAFGGHHLPLVRTYLVRVPMAALPAHLLDVALFNDMAHPSHEPKRLRHPHLAGRRRTVHSSAA